MIEKKIMWKRKLSCGCDRLTTIAYFLCEDYTKPKVGDECYCRKCMMNTTIIGVEEFTQEIGD